MKLKVHRDPPPKNTGSGAYNFDSGDVCFKDLTEIVAARASKREKAVIAQRIYAERRKERHEKRTNVNRGYKLKHG